MNINFELKAKTVDDIKMNIIKKLDELDREELTNLKWFLLTRKENQIRNNNEKIKIKQIKKTRSSSPKKKILRKRNLIVSPPKKVKQITQLVKQKNRTKIKEDIEIKNESKNKNIQKKRKRSKNEKKNKKINKSVSKKSILDNKKRNLTKKKQKINEIDEPNLIILK